MYHHAVRNRKKNRVPLSKLRATDAAKTVVDQPRRLEELLRILEDKDRGVRGRAAVALSKLSESHPARLLRVVVRLRERMEDDSAYVRWHLLYALGRLGARYPMKAREFLPDVIARLEDDNRVCRVIALRALVQVSSRRPAIVEECFQNLKKDIPPAVAKILRKS